MGTQHVSYVHTETATEGKRAGYLVCSGIVANSTGVFPTAWDQEEGPKEYVMSRDANFQKLK